MRGFGIQLSSRRYLTILGLSLTISRMSLFLPMHTVKSVAIMEGIRGWSIIFYLAVMCETEEEGVRIHVVYPVRPASLFKRYTLIPESEAHLATTSGAPQDTQRDADYRVWCECDAQESIEHM